LNRAGYLEPDSPHPPEGLTFRHGYWEDADATRRFKEFVDAIHGLDLSLWEAKGFWDHDNYTAFTLFEGDRVVATTNLYSVEMQVEGERRRLGQFSGVGTLPGCRRRGWNRWLTRRAMEWAEPSHAGFFLFADEAAKPFYASCGFVPLDESLDLLRRESPPAQPGLRKLNPDDDEHLRLLYRLACQRSPVSDQLGAWSPKLLMFHCLYTLRDHLYHLPALDLAVFCEVVEDRLTVYDVVGRRLPPFEVLHPYLSQRPHREVCFRFMPDKLDVRPDCTIPLSDSNAHVFPPLRLPRPRCSFPYCSHA
jgi:GNAT superfamily N-acetyltransferase